MADSIADNAELAVDELKRRARRRLIGAIVLALAAATLLPLLLEQEQKPLGDDVSVQIPPIDKRKFVGRLPSERGKETPPQSRADTRTAGTGDARPETTLQAKAVARSEPKVDAKSPPRSISEPETKAGARADPNVNPKAESTAIPRPEPKAGPRPAPTPAAVEAKSSAPVAVSVPALPKAAAGAEPAAAVPDAPDAEPPKREGFIVQLGAYTDVYGARALARKLIKAGYPAYTEPVETSRGTLWRVRVGGYPSRAAASEARERLKTDGQDGVVSAAR